jgi:hypothetical protein
MRLDEIFFLDVDDVLDAHAVVIARFGGSDGLRDRGLLESAVMAARSGYYGSLKERSSSTTVSTKLERIAKLAQRMRDKPLTTAARARRAREKRRGSQLHPRAIALALRRPSRQTGHRPLRPCRPLLPPASTTRGPQLQPRAVDPMLPRLSRQT